MDEAYVQRIVARNLRRLRQKRGMTQVELADRAGVESSYLSKADRTGKNLTIDLIGRLCLVLQVEPGELFELNPQERSALAKAWRDSSFD